MVKWNNLDTLASFQDLSNVKRVNLQEAMSGENGAERVKKYSTAMAEGLVYNYAAKSVDDNVLAALEKLAEEFYRDSSFKLDNSNRDRSLIDYDYFEENPNDFMQHQSICFQVLEE